MVYGQKKLATFLWNIKGLFVASIATIALMLLLYTSYTVTNYEIAFDEYERTWKEVLDRQQRRIIHLQSQCSELGLSKNLRNLTQDDMKVADFLVDDIHKVILKAVQKTGCTSWRSLFVQNSPIKGYNVGAFAKSRYKEIGLGVLHENLLEEAFSKLDSYFTVLTVRHPLKRLESYFSRNLLNSLIKFHLNGSFPSEAQTMEYFRKFTNDVLTHKKTNYHWDSIYNRSHPCTVYYRYVAKTETANSDMEYIATAILKGNTTTKEKNGSILNNQNDQNNTTGQLLPLFSNLPNAQSVIQKFTEMYYIDMRLFGYNVSFHNGKYYAICSEHHTTVPC